MKKFVPYEQKHLKKGLRVKLRNGSEGTISYLGNTIFTVNNVLTVFSETGLCIYDTSGTNPFDVVEIEVEEKHPKAQIGYEFRTKANKWYKIIEIFPEDGVMLCKQINVDYIFYHVYKLDGTALNTKTLSNGKMSSQVPFEV